MANDFTPVGVELVVKNVNRFERSVNHVNDNVLELTDSVEDMGKAMVRAQRTGTASLNDGITELLEGILQVKDAVDRTGTEVTQTGRQAETMGRKLPVRLTETFGQKLRGIVNMASNVVTALGTIVRGVIGLGKAIVRVGVSIGRQVIGLGQKALGAAVTFQSAFAGVEKTVGGLDEVIEESGMTWRETLETQFRELAKTTPVALEELLKIGELGGQLGIAKEGLIDFTKTIAGMGVSTSLSTENAAMSMARMAAIMGTSTEDLSRMGSSIVALGNSFETTEPQILSFGLRVAGAGKLAGLTEADVFAIGTAMSSVGVQAEAGGTAVQKVLLKMNEVVAGSSQEFVDNTQAIGGTQASIKKLYEDLEIAEMRYAELGESAKASTRAQSQLRIDRLTQDILEQEAALGSLIAGHGALAEGEETLATFAATAGMEVEKFKELWEKDAVEAFTLFVEGLGYAGDDAMGILKDLGLEDQRLIRSFLSLSGAGKKLRNTVNLSSDAWDENVALTREAGQRYKTFASQSQLVQAQMKDLFITAGKFLMPVGAEIMGNFMPILEEVGKQLPAVMEKFVVPALQKVGQTITDVMTLGLKGFQEGGLFGALGGVMTGLGVGIEEQAGIFDWINKIGGIVDWVIEKFGMLTTWLKTAIPAAIQTVSNFWTGVLQPAIQQVWGFIQGNVFPVLQVLWSWLQQMIPIALQVVSDYFNLYMLPAFNAIKEAWVTTLQPALADLWAWLQERIPPVIQFLSDLWNNVLSPVLAFFGTLLSEVIIPVLAEVAGWLIENIPKAIDTVVQFWNETLMPALQDAWTWIGENLIPIFEDIWAWLEENVPAAIETAVKFWEETLLPALEGVWKWISETFGPLWEAIVELFEVTLTKAIEIATGAWENTLKPALEDLWDWLTTNFQPIWETILEIIDKVVTSVGKLAADVKETVMPELKKFWEWLTDKFQKALDGIQEVIAKIATKINEWVEAIKNLELPAWAKPGSPTPFEMGLRGINAEMTKLARSTLPAFTMQMQMLATPVMSAAPAMMSSSNVQIGPNTIQQGMSEAAFYANVQRAVGRSLDL